MKWKTSFRFNIPLVLPMRVPSTEISFLMRVLGSQTVSQGMTEKGKEDIRIRTKALTKPPMAPEKMYESFRKQT